MLPSAGLFPTHRLCFEWFSAVVARLLIVNLSNQALKAIESCLCFRKMLSESRRRRVRRRSHMARKAAGSCSEKSMSLVPGGESTNQVERIRDGGRSPGPSRGRGS